MAIPLPTQAQKYFWGDDLEQLDWQDHRQYVIQTLLDKGDAESVAWLLQQATRADLLEMLPTLRLSPRSSNFWKVYLS